MCVCDHERHCHRHRWCIDVSSGRCCMCVCVCVGWVCVCVWVYYQQRPVGAQCRSIVVSHVPYCTMCAATITNTQITFTTRTIHHICATNGGVVLSSPTSSCLFVVDVANGWCTVRDDSHRYHDHHCQPHGYCVFSPSVTMCGACVTIICLLRACIGSISIMMVHP